MASTNDSLLSVLAFTATAVVSVTTLWWQRAKDNREGDAHDRDSDVNQFGVVGDLATKLAGQIVDASNAERAKCDVQLAAMRAEFDARLAVAEAHIAECQERLAATSSATTTTTTVTTTD